ncbi:MAG: rhodanese-like domain-containing protein [Candidatus Marinimicrobia bacterium]|nr:rhodanese-like domain-containing protein [Candidatus Neomarinimicrobiota bacterium]
MNKIFKGRMYRWIFTVVISVIAIELNDCSTMKPFTNILPEKAEPVIQKGVQEGKIILIDVRTPEEFNSGYIAGAINMNVNSEFFDVQIDELDKTKTYIVYCKMGGRSTKAMTLMKEKGFKKVFNLEGGITQWQKENRPVVTPTK